MIATTILIISIPEVLQKNKDAFISGMVKLYLISNIISFITLMVAVQDKSGSSFVYYFIAFLFQLLAPPLAFDAMGIYYILKMLTGGK